MKRSSAVLFTGLAIGGLLLAGCSSSEPETPLFPSVSPVASSPATAPVAGMTTAPSVAPSAPSDDSTMLSMPAAGASASSASVAPSSEGSWVVTGDLGAKPSIDISPDSGNVTKMIVKDEVVGSGKAVTPRSTVTVQYVGMGGKSKTEFDSSWKGGQPVTFPLNGVIKGWSEGLVGMKEGGRRLLVIPADLAYGQTPPPGSGIAPGETLVFVVDMNKVA